MEILKSFKADVKETDLKYGTVSFASWERLKPFLNTALSITEKEEIVGIRIDKDGITAKIEYKH